MSLPEKGCGVIALALCMLFTGCTAAHRPVTIELGAFAGSAWRVPNPDTFVLYDDIIARFEQANPGIRVRYKSGILRDDFSEWLSSLILRGKEPDCFFVLQEDLHLFADIGVLHPLDVFIRESYRLQSASIFESAMLAGKLNGIQYAVPVEIDPTLLFVNTSILDREGIAFPEEAWTWDDFLAICAATTKDIDGDGLLDQFGSDGFDWLTALYTNRAPLFDYNGSRAFFDSEEVYNGFVFLDSLNSLSLNQRVPDFESGKVTFSVSSYSWYRAYGYYPYSILKSGKYAWRATVLPRGPSGKNSADLKALFLGVSARSRHKKEALSFMEFLLTDDRTQTQFLEKTKGIPAREDIVRGDAVRSILLKDITLAGNEIGTQTLVDSIADAMLVPAFRRYRPAVSFIEKELADIPANGDQLKNFLSQLNIKINEFLRQ